MVRVKYGLAYADSASRKMSVVYSRHLRKLLRRAADVDGDRLTSREFYYYFGPFIFTDTGQLIYVM